MSTSGELSPGDIVIVFIYLVLILAVGLATLLRKERGGTHGYFLAGSTVPWWQVGASVFASNIGSEHFVGIAGTAAATGYAVTLFEWMAILSILPLLFFFLPVYFASAIYTIPEYLGKRFGGQRIRMYLALFSLLFYVFTKISVDLFAGALFIQTVLKWKLYPAVLLLLAVTAIYTVAGGLAAVVYTETVQTVIMIIGALSVTFIGFREIGGISELGARYLNATSSTPDCFNGTIDPVFDKCRDPPSDSLHLFRGVTDALPALGFFTGQILSGTYYWGTEQVQVQRSLCAKNLANGQGGLILTTWLKLTPMFLITMPGMISRILYPDAIGCVGDACLCVCGNPKGCSDIAYPLLVVNLLPNGLKGIIVSVMLSALMSSLASTFNSASTIFTLDIWTTFRKLTSGETSSERQRKRQLEQVLVGRAFVIVMVVISVLWIPVIIQSGQGKLYTYINKISNSLTTPNVAVIILAIFWHRITEPGAFWALIVGFITSCVRIILEVSYPDPLCGETDTRPAFIQTIMIHYMYFSAINFCITVLVAVIISYCTPAIPEVFLYRLTFWTRKSSKERRPLSPGRLKASSEYQTFNNDEYAMDGISRSGDTNPDLQNEPNAASSTAVTTDDAATIEVAATNVRTDVTDNTTSTLQESGDENTDQSQPSRFNDDTNSRQIDSKWKNYLYWFLGMSTVEGTRVEIESEDERERASQKKLDMTRTQRIAIGLNLIPLFIVYTFVLTWFR